MEAISRETVQESHAGHYDPSPDTMRNLAMCRKVYSRARSSIQDDPSVSSADLRNALRFTLTAAHVSRDPTCFWNQLYWSLGTGDSHSPEDFDWLVDYYLDIYSGDQEVAFDILALLGGIEVRCSPAKQHQFIRSLVACMGTDMPLHLRFAALRAAQIVHEEIASIDAIDVQHSPMILTTSSIITATYAISN
ncbi:hypothetical protein BD769DRAFT_634904 [Suillus cothurnatus]|nr:hypothetical protein BD769DRAFT_634904 [Suillus cothurnatus]